MHSVLASYLTIVCFLDYRRIRSSASSSGGYEGAGSESDSTFPIAGDGGAAKMGDRSAVGSYQMRGLNAR